MPQPLFYIVTSILCGWIILRVLGGERQRKIQVIESKIAADRTPPPAAAKAPSPARDKAATGPTFRRV